MAFRVISFYRYTPISNPRDLQQTLRNQCKAHQIVGRILIGTEGINGAVSGLDDDIDTLKQFLLARFENLTFRERPAHSQAYHKLIVRTRKEICAFQTPVDLSNKGEYLEPSELHEMYENHEDFFILDARNEYEAQVGKFEGAHVLPIETFKEFAGAAKQLDVPKDKKIVMYCTGGIRCEKASAFMKAQGYKNVYHLKGGIINYLNQYPGEHYEGGCFVFDDRLLDQAERPITNCVHCGKKTAHMTNCHNLDCDRLFIICAPCAEQYSNTCSQSCHQSPRQRVEKHARPLIGKVENYYPKSKVALLRVTKPIKPGYELCISGKTTKNVCVNIHHMRDYDGNEITGAKSQQLITIPVPYKVRKNDAVRLVHA